jgi:hypothetical protein
MLSSASSLSLQQLTRLLESLSQTTPTRVLRQILCKHYALTEESQSALLAQALWQHTQAQQRLQQLALEHDRQLEELNARLLQLDSQLDRLDALHQAQRSTYVSRLIEFDAVLTFLGEELTGRQEPPQPQPQPRRNPRILSARASSGVSGEHLAT